MLLTTVFSAYELDEGVKKNPCENLNHSHMFGEVQDFVCLEGKLFTILPLIRF